jgi:hypothetical protein
MDRVDSLKKILKIWNENITVSVNIENQKDCLNVNSVFNNLSKKLNLINFKFICRLNDELLHHNKENDIDYQLIGFWIFFLIQKFFFI